MVCIYYGNTGSSWLLAALSGSPAMYVPGFEPIEGWAWDVSAAERLDWLETMLSPPDERTGPVFEAWVESLLRSPQVKNGPGRTGWTYTALKMNDLAASETDSVIDIVDRTGSKVIHLARANRIKHALSMYRYHDEQKSQFHLQDEYPPTKVDFRRFNDWLRESQRLHDQGMAILDKCEAQLGADRVFRLTYEEFTDDEGKSRTLQRLADFIGIPPDFGDGHYAKATPDSLRAAISNYPTFALRYRFTRWSKYLD